MSGQDNHAISESSREQGDFLNSLESADVAIVSYQEENNLAGIAEVLGSRVLTLRHLFEKTGEKAYLIIAKHEAMAAVEIDPSAMPYYNLGRIYDTLGEIDNAIENYRKAIEAFNTNPPEGNSRPAVLLDMKLNLSFAEYRSGDKEAVDRALVNLSELENTDEPQYNKDVWVSGAYMKLAEITKDRKYLERAKEIIDSNPELVLRKNQWQKLSENFS